jgi:hypothetical protein
MEYKSQIQKNSFCMIPFTPNAKKRKSSMLLDVLVVVAFGNRVWEKAHKNASGLEFNNILFWSRSCIQSCVQLVKFHKDNSCMFKNICKDSCGDPNLQSKHFGRLRLEDPLSSGVGSHPGQHSKILFQQQQQP